MTEDGLAGVLIANRAILVRFLRVRGASDDAEDLAQELWVRARGVDMAQIRDPLAFLFRMADNLMIDRRRSRLRAERRDSDWAGAGADAPGAGGPSIEQALLGRERLRIVEARIATLGERTAAIFCRFRLDGAGQREIAEEQGISLSAVEKHLRKCYRLLADLKAADDAETGPSERPWIGGTDDARQ